MEKLSHRLCEMLKIRKVLNDRGLRSYRLSIGLSSSVRLLNITKCLPVMLHRNTQHFEGMHAESGIFDSLLVLQD